MRIAAARRDVARCAYVVEKVFVGFMVLPLSQSFALRLLFRKREGFFCWRRHRATAATAGPAAATQKRVCGLWQCGNVLLRVRASVFSLQTLLDCGGVWQARWDWHWRWRSLAFCVADIKSGILYAAHTRTKWSLRETNPSCSRRPFGFCGFRVKGEKERAAAPQ